MSQGSNRISNSIEMNAAVVELLEDVMKENDGKEGKENVIFSQKAKTLVKEIADFSRNTRIYREAEARREEFRNETKDATPALIYGYLLDRVVNARGGQKARLAGSTRKGKGRSELWNTQRQ